jgi:hypothetical protein
MALLGGEFGMRHWRLHALTAALLWAAHAAAQPDPTARAQRNLLVWAERDGFRLVDSIADAERPSFT